MGESKSTCKSAHLGFIHAAETHEQNKTMQTITIYTVPYFILQYDYIVCQHCLHTAGLMKIATVLSAIPVGSVCVAIAHLVTTVSAIPPPAHVLSGL